MSWERERRGRLDLGVHRLFDTTSRLFDDFTGEVHLHGEGGDFVLENEELFLVEAFFASEDLLDQLVHVLFAVAETFHHTREAFGRVGLGVVELVHARGVSFLCRLDLLALRDVANGAGLSGLICFLHIVDLIDFLRLVCLVVLHGLLERRDSTTLLPWLSDRGLCLLHLLQLLHRDFESSSATTGNWITHCIGS